MDFGVIARAGLSQTEFAALCGVSRVTANTWVRGKMQPHRYIKVKIGAVLERLQDAAEFGELPLALTVKKVDRQALLRAAIRNAQDRKTTG